MKIVEKKYNTGKVEYVIQLNYRLLIFSWWSDYPTYILHNWTNSAGYPRLSLIYPTFKSLAEAQDHLPYFEKFLENQKEKEIERIISLKECSKK